MRQYFTCPGKSHRPDRHPEAALKTEVDTLKARLDGAMIASTALQEKYRKLQGEFIRIMEEDRQASEQVNATYITVRNGLKDGAKLPAEDIKAGPALGKAAEEKE